MGLTFDDPKGKLTKLVYGKKAFFLIRISLLWKLGFELKTGLSVHPVQIDRGDTLTQLATIHEEGVERGEN